MIVRYTIFQGYACNNKCRFCCNGHRRDVETMSTAKIQATMKEGREKGATFVDFIGGEATIRKDIVKLIAYAKEIGYERICTTTNGRMYSIYEFAKKMVDAGLNSIVLSIHGPNAEIHDYLTRAEGAFEQAMNGLKNLVELGVTDIEINTTVLKQNYKHLPKMQQMFLDKGVRSSNFIFPDPTKEGYAYDYFYELVPTYAEAMPYVRKAIGVGVKGGATQINTQYVPFCFLKGFEKHAGEIMEPETEHHAPDFVNKDVMGGRIAVGKLKGDQCKKCKYFYVCEGVWKQYGKKVGLSELVPVKGEFIKDKEELKKILGIF